MTDRPTTEPLREGIFRVWYRRSPGMPERVEPIHNDSDLLDAYQDAIEAAQGAAPRAEGPPDEPRTFDELRDWMRHDPEWARATAEKMAGLLREWADAWAGPSGDPYDPDHGPLNSTRSGLYDESRAILGGDR